MQQKIVELHKLENSECCWKKNMLKIPVSTIRAIIKKLQSTEMLEICLEEDVYIVLKQSQEGSLSAQTLSKDCGS